MDHTQKKIKITFLAVLLIKLHVLIINSAKKLFFTEGKMLLTDLLKSAEEEEEKFQLTNSCWICDKLFDVGDDKVRDHCHITGKYRGAAEEFSGELLKLVKQKGVYPYKCINSFKKFSENKLPDRSKFFSSLKDERISEKDYLKANNI